MNRFRFHTKEYLSILRLEDQFIYFTTYIFRDVFFPKSKTRVFSYRFNDSVT